MKIMHDRSGTLLRRLSPLLAFAFLGASGADVYPAPKTPKPKAAKPKATKPTAAKPTAKAATAKTALRLKRHAFPDAGMGMPAAYTVMLPPGWTAKGKIEWRPVGEALFPQQIFEITSPQQGRITRQPLETFSYMESELMGSQGVPPPADIVQWLAQVVPQTDPGISNVKIIRSNRDARTEAALNEMERATGGGQGMQREVHAVVMEYDERNVRRREEFTLTYVRFQPYLTPNLRSYLWSLAPGTSISAPAKQFAAQRTALLNVAATLQPTPQWYLQSQAAIAEMSRQRAANNWAIIQARGRQISQLSDAQYARYKKATAAGDAAQRQRIQGIYETSDYKDTNGNIVNLPMHYKHVFSDGKGNYVLSNNSLDKPGSQWKSIRPMK